MTHGRIRAWQTVHTWTSLICTVFMLVLCVTGLPLVFHDELEQFLEPHAPYAQVAPGQRAGVDAMVARAKARHPGNIATTIRINPDEPQVVVFTAPSWKAVRADPRLLAYTAFDAGSGAMRETSPPVTQQSVKFLELMLRLHVDLFLRLPGQFFLGVMGLCLLAAMVSGVVLYGPFTRKLAFGEIRVHRSNRAKWLDLHNLLGAVTLAWFTVVAATGVLNEISQPLYQRHMATDVAALTRQWRGQAPVDPAQLTSIDNALRVARQAEPGMDPIILFYPGNIFSTPHHFMIWSQGRTPLTARMQTSILVDAKTGRLAAVVQQPWYLKAVQISRPLHFGDFGGLPLKLLWTLLDLATVTVLGSGLYLWIARRRRPARAAQLNLRMAPDPAE